MVQSGEFAATLALESIKKHGEGAADVLGKAAGRAKEQGKGKASATHLIASDPAKLHKKYGPALFDIIGRYLDTKPDIPDPFGQELDALFAKAGG